MFSTHSLIRWTVVTLLILCTLPSTYAQEQQRLTYILTPVGAFTQADAKECFDDLRGFTVRELSCTFNAKSREIAVITDGSLIVDDLLRQLEELGWFIAVTAPLPDGSPFPGNFDLRSVQERWVEANPKLRTTSKPFLVMTEAQYVAISAEKREEIESEFEIILE